jgi:hypothetical protein
MALTRKNALIISIKFWKSMQENGYNYKVNSKLYNTVRNYDYQCPLCALYCSNCSKCPLKDCTSKEATFDLWCHAETKETRQFFAGLLVQELEKFLKENY